MIVFIIVNKYYLFTAQRCIIKTLSNSTQFNLKGSKMKNAVDAVVKEATAVVKAPKVKKEGIGKFVMDMMLDTKTAKWTNKEILDKVGEKFPEAKTTYACIAWYRTHLRGLGKIPQRAKKVVETQPAA